MADWEMIDRIGDVLRKHHIMTKPTAAIIAFEIIKAMREPTDKMMDAGDCIDTINLARDTYTATIDAVLND